MKWFYLSFADQNRFRGGAVVEASGSAHAIERTQELGIYPGGAAAVFEVPVESLPIAETAKNRLLSKLEVQAILGPSIKVEWEDE